jgi:hypothetical protein
MIPGNQIEPGLSARPERRRRWRLFGALLLIGLGAIGGYAAGAHKPSSPAAGVQQSASIPLESESGENPNNDGD